ncbi:MAG: biotin-dependent carboxyltransferase family protein [Lysobacter sp.]|nr:biotin-dependent carboxyltransferase family protein [Lysobacter sp.]
MTLHVRHGGALTTVQDSGRSGWRHLGVAHAGALDPAQASLANRLVGNPAYAAVLELTLRGPVLEFAQPTRMALCGARIDAHFEDARAQRHVVPLGRPVTLPAGTLRLGMIRNGLRAWLAVAGGIDVPRVLGSRSTDLRGGFGGLDGRALCAGDALPLGAHPAIEVDAPTSPNWWIALDATASAQDAIRYVPGASPEAPMLAERAWTVDARSNRQGLRCVGDAIAATTGEQISAPVAPGTIQRPPDGQPIVLLADAQTVGGYPRLGHVIAADLPRLAQWRAGDALRFVAVDAIAARAAAQRRQGDVARLHWAIDLALHDPSGR